MKSLVLVLGWSAVTASGNVTKVARQNCPLTVTKFADVKAAVSSSCRSIILDSINIPAQQFLDLKKLKPNTVVTFAGTTTLEHYVLKSKDEQSQSPIQIGGSYVTITSAPNSTIDGNGAAWWDGFGSNEPNCEKAKVPARCKDGKVPWIYKPNYLLKFSKLDHSTITGLRIKNYPVHGISVSNTRNLTMDKIYLDNEAGEAPNEKSTPLAAAHNTDGFGLANSTMITLTNSTVLNQDDCVAITSGTGYLVRQMLCVGGHGLSIGSIGGKGGGEPEKNQVGDVVFEDSVLWNQQNGLRIKTNAGETGLVRNITFRNIALYNTTDFGITIRQDYDNSGPTCEPTSGIPISDVTIENISGTMSPTKQNGRNVHIFCGPAKGSCSNFKLSNITITGGKGDSRCNFHEFGAAREVKVPFECPHLGSEDCK